MCYAFSPVQDPTGHITWLPPKVVKQYIQEGKIQEPKWTFPGDRTDIYRWTKNGIEPTQMRFDLVPRFYLKKENLPLEEMLKRKRSKKKGGGGFDSYNARSESIFEKASFRTPWAEGNRMVVRVDAFRERPNMDEAPKEFRGREYIIRLGSPKNLAGVWDRWENRQGESLESFSIVTLDSLGNQMLRGIWHERCPLILDDSQVEEWLDPKTSPERAKELIRLYSAEQMTLEEVKRAQKKVAEQDQQSLL